MDKIFALDIIYLGCICIAHRCTIVERTLFFGAIHMSSFLRFSMSFLSEEIKNLSEKLKEAKKTTPTKIFIDATPPKSKEAEATSVASASIAKTIDEAPSAKSVASTTVVVSTSSLDSFFTKKPAEGFKPVIKQTPIPSIEGWIEKYELRKENEKLRKEIDELKRKLGKNEKRRKANECENKIYIENADKPYIEEHGHDCYTISWSYKKH